MNDSGEAPFSELISRWLDEGERLSEMGEAAPAGPGLPAERRLPAAIARLRSRLARHRAATIAFAVAMSAAAIAITRGVMHRVLVAEAPAVEPARAAPPPAPAIAPAPAPVAVASAAVVVLPAAAEVPPDAVEAPAPAEAPAIVQPSASLAQADYKGVCRKALDSEQTQKALAACRRAADAEPASADAVVLRAHAELLAGRQEETLRLARKAMALDSSCAEAYLLIGNVEQMSGSKFAARSAYQAYLDHAPSGPHAAEVRAILRTL